MTDYQDILNRLTAPSRELDAEICVALRYVPEVHDALFVHYSKVSGGIYTLSYMSEKSLGLNTRGYALCPFITSSVDAALALLEAKLPGWRVYDIMQKTRSWEVTLQKLGGDFKGEGFRGEASTLPLAIIRAILRALVAVMVQEASHE